MMINWLVIDWSMQWDTFHLNTTWKAYFVKKPKTIERTNTGFPNSKWGFLDICFGILANAIKNQADPATHIIGQNSRKYNDSENPEVIYCFILTDFSKNAKTAILKKQLWGQTPCKKQKVKMMALWKNKTNCLFHLHINHDEKIGKEKMTKPLRK